MRHFKFSFLLIAFFGTSYFAHSQTGLPKLLEWDTDYSDCAAILYNGKMLVDEYSPQGKCKVNVGMKGKLNLYTVTLSDKGGTPKRKLKFHVAILNKNTNNMWMYTKSAVEEIMLEDVLNECKKDDKIIILNVDKSIALTHHEIEVLRGC